MERVGTERWSTLVGAILCWGNGFELSSSDRTLPLACGAFQFGDAPELCSHGFACAGLQRLQGQHLRDLERMGLRSGHVRDHPNTLPVAVRDRTD